MSTHANYYAKLTRRLLQQWHIWLCHMGADHYQCLDRHISVPDKCAALIFSCEPKDKPSVAWGASSLWRLHRAEIFKQTAPSFLKSQQLFPDLSLRFKTDGLQTHPTTASCEEINDFQGQRSACVPVPHQWRGKYLMRRNVCFLFPEWELHNGTGRHQRHQLPPPRLLLLYGLGSTPLCRAQPRVCAVCLRSFDTINGKFN